MLIQITAPHFCAGIGLLNDRVNICAPILKYMWGWDEHKARYYCKEKGWKCEIVTLRDLVEN